MVRGVADAPAHDHPQSDRHIRGQETPALRSVTDQEGTIYHDVISMVERPLIELALSVTGGNKVRAAQLLGMNRNTLRSKINSLEIASPD